MDAENKPKRKRRQTKPSEKSTGESNGFWHEFFAPYRGKKLRQWLSKCSYWAAELFVAYQFSVLLQSFTDAALWLPSEFREGIAFGSTLGFVAVSEFASLFAEQFLGPAHYEKKHKTETDLWKLMKRTGATALLLIFFFISIWQSHKLRTASVWPFAPQPSWWAKQYGTNETADFITNQNEVVCNNLPDFLSQERKIIYFPPEINDPKLSNYIAKIGSGDLIAGIKITLDHEPMRLIDWAEGDGRNIREEYSFKFLLWHFGMIFFMACAVGVLQKKVEIIFDGLIKFLPEKLIP